MTIDERLERLAVTVQETSRIVEQTSRTVEQTSRTVDALGKRADSIENSLNTLAKTAAETAVLDASIMAKHQVVLEAHDQQIAELFAALDRMREEGERLDRRWQAYLNTLPRQ